MKLVSVKHIVSALTHTSTHDEEQVRQLLGSCGILEHKDMCAAHAYGASAATPPERPFGGATKCPVRIRLRMSHAWWAARLQRAVQPVEDGGRRQVHARRQAPQRLAPQHSPLIRRHVMHCQVQHRFTACQTCLQLPCSLRHPPPAFAHHAPATCQALVGKASVEPRLVQLITCTW